MKGLRRPGDDDAAMGLDPRMADFLAACQSWKRKFYFCFEGPLLRKGNSPKAKKERRKREDLIRTEIKTEMDKHGRRQFRGLVSISLAFFGGEPQIPTMVKAYLDCVQGIVYPDDRAVGHLLVSRWPPGDGAERHGEERVFFSVEPLSMYAASFDYVFAHHRDLDSSDDCFWAGDAPSWADPFEPGDEMEARRLERELDWDDDYEEGEDEFADLDRVELARELRASKAGRLAALRLKRVLDQPLHYLDRPGRPPRWLEPLLVEHPDLDIATSPDARDSPGTLWLPPPGAPGWRDAVRSELEMRRTAWDLRNAPIKRPVGVDIAVQQLEPPGKDLDNLAHEILVPFEEVFSDGHRGQVQVYRAYGRIGSRAGVRVRLMERRRLEATHRLIEDAHFKRLKLAHD